MCVYVCVGKGGVWCALAHILTSTHEHTCTFTHSCLSWIEFNGMRGLRGEGEANSYVYKQIIQNTMYYYAVLYTLTSTSSSGHVLGWWWWVGLAALRAPPPPAATGTQDTTHE